MLEKRARQLVQAGYQKLTAFECDDAAHPGSKRGYEWFGGAAPPHEALTAYGLLQFRDMARVTAVDDAMLQRTEKFLLDQRDGEGGFKRNPKGIDQFGHAPDPVTNAYIVWALTESGVKDNLNVELAALKKVCKTSKDPYFLSLVALSQFNRQKHQEGMDLLLDLRAAQKDGQVAGAQTSITGSQGHDLAVETTSLAILAFLKANRFEFDATLGSAIRWLGKQLRCSVSFVGTHATILALKAMLAYHERQPKALQGGEVQMFVRTNQPRLPGVNFVPGQVQQDELQGISRARLRADALGRADHALAAQCTRSAAWQKCDSAHRHRQQCPPLHAELVVPHAQAAERSAGPGQDRDQARHGPGAPRKGKPSSWPPPLRTFQAKARE